MASMSTCTPGKRSWIVIVTGFFEPLFYLFGIGLGLGALVPPIDGISYSAYVAPGLLASLWPAGIGGRGLAGGVEPGGHG